MSYHLVRTCPRCGSKAEMEITPAMVGWVRSVLLAFFRYPERHRDCPKCRRAPPTTPEIDGIELVIDELAARRARKRGSV